MTNNFVEPRLTAHAVDLNPLVVLVALAFWGLCWGVVGMVLAVPLTVMLKIVFENIGLTLPLARTLDRGLSRRTPIDITSKNLSLLPVDLAPRELIFLGMDPRRGPSRSGHPGGVIKAVHAPEADGRDL